MGKLFTRETWSIGQVIARRDKQGKFIKGHRHLPKEHYKKMLHANFQRRIVPEKQMKEWINGIAEEMIKEGKESPLGKLIDEELGNVIAYRTIMRYLNEEYKQERKVETLPRGKDGTEVVEKEAEKELKQELKTSEDYKAGARALKKKAKELETKKTLSEVNKGKKFTEEHRQNLSSALKGKKKKSFTQNHKKNLSISVSKAITEWWNKRKNSGGVC